MLKFKDSNDRVIGELGDNDPEPVFYEEDAMKKKKAKTSKTKRELGVYEKSVLEQTDPNYVASGVGVNNK